ncbi:hypothetical protein [Ensifer sp. ZNC0028]|uniref:hypothetical protein n=1 Tax=Ensifer sp. ZNC0028 TaxID=1339236 RepID=UPI001FD882C4|nr:hypothetical protein [Ensifer sp. ZNC0028]
MVFIRPEFDCRGGGGADVSGLIASIKFALASEAPFDTQNLCFRVLGRSIVIEGQVGHCSGDDFVRRIAEDIAGADRVLVRVGCPRSNGLSATGNTTSMGKGDA